MKLGAYEFAWQPDRYTIPQAERVTASTRTYTSTAFFSWGVDIVGQIIGLEWEFCSEAQYAQMRAVLEADTGVVWDPNRPGYGGMTYNVEVRSVSGEYFEVVDEEAPYRKNVRVEMMIMSEAGYGVGS